jgi:hypothetical protein
MSSQQLSVPSNLQTLFAQVGEISDLVVALNADLAKIADDTRLIGTGEYADAFRKTLKSPMDMLGEVLQGTGTLLSNTSEGGKAVQHVITNADEVATHQAVEFRP